MINRLFFPIITIMMEMTQLENEPIQCINAIIIAMIRIITIGSSLFIVNDECSNNTIIFVFTLILNEYNIVIKQCTIEFDAKWLEQVCMPIFFPVFFFCIYFSFFFLSVSCGACVLVSRLCPNCV